MENISVRLVVNGKEVIAQVPPQMLLLTFLRERLRLTGTKNGCSQGHCGVCMIIIDGEAKRSCLIKMSQADGKRVETIEGLAPPGELHPLQTAFIRQGAIQCGFCTPGMIMSAKALLDENPSPSVEEIKSALARNLCRCTGYVSIIRAVQKASEMMRQGIKSVSPPSLLERSYQVVGQSVARKDAVLKAKGDTKYADDLFVEGMVYAKALRSEYPHAEILGIDTREAEATPGVIAVLTAKDVPGHNGFGLIFPHQPVLARDKVRYVGDAVALVVAETQDIAEEALRKIRVDYRELRGVFTPQEALLPDAPKIHDEGNILKHHKIRRGDIDKGFAEADVIIEGRSYTPFIEHAYLEPEASLAIPEKDGCLTVYSASQGVFTDRDQISAILNLPKEKVRVIHLPTGGAFGGKEEPVVQVLSALAAYHTKRPVKVVFSRKESIRVHPKRHAQYLHYRTGAAREGRIVAVEVEILGDTGAYASLGAEVLFRSACFSCGPYRIPNVKVDAYAVYTNNVPCGAMRGFGNPQPAFAAESQMDRVAEQLGLDPLEIREINALEEGDTTITGHILESSVGIKESLAAVKKAVARTEQEMQERRKRGSKIGVGVACAYKNVGLGGVIKDAAGAIVELKEDGTIKLSVGTAEMGQGTYSAMAQIAAQTLGINYDKIEVFGGDTSSEILDSGVTTASRQTFVSGNAVLAASQKLKETILSFASQEFNIDPQRISIRGDRIVDKGDGRNLIGLAELAALARKKGQILRADHYYLAPRTYPLPERADWDPSVSPETYRIHFSYCFGTQAAIVEVDEETGEVKVLKVIAAHDVGKAIHPRNVKGQMEGGVVMGLGYALREEFRLEEGRIITDTLSKCHIPTIRETPEIEAIIVEDSHPQGPYGAKGMGEVPMSPTAPAIINAIHDALGIRITELPATREKILQALEEKGRFKKPSSS
ncbi:hypothetical protein HKBW3S25_00168 [Candidatus Hakubella thermalkaliphila]|uniref:2Fe-2S ferredoxin-type domain-containing protein n=2 Tax=Candidatus Hakubella thermalkaliphila TaxID=2754717 RepID=A0A6V8NZU5_9ACTN|nr:hypothetical protein HKBW3S25_00168 [Candidatus Hakubella thermalkaliphila]